MKYLKFLLILACSSVNFLCFAVEQTEDDKMLAVQKAEIIDVTVQMLGMGLTQVLNDDYYIGAFYLDENVQYDGTDDFFFLEVARRMEFRFAAAKGVSARSFKRKIAESIRINNSRNDTNAQKTLLARLMKIFTGYYKKGDILQFDYHHSFGTRITFNGKRLGQIERSHALYNLLVKMWVGERPPNSKFKQGIIGKNDGDYAIKLLRRFIHLDS